MNDETESPFERALWNASQALSDCLWHQRDDRHSLTEQEFRDVVAMIVKCQAIMDYNTERRAA